MVKDVCFFYEICRFVHVWTNRIVLLMTISAKYSSVEEWSISVSCFFCQIFSPANGAEEAQGIVGRTPPQSAARAKSRQAKTPTQAGEFVHTHYIPCWLSFIFTFLSYLFTSQSHNWYEDADLIAHLSSQNEVFCLSSSGSEKCSVQACNRCVTHTGLGPSRCL